MGVRGVFCDEVVDIDLAIAQPSGIECDGCQSGIPSDCCGANPEDSSHL